MEIMSRLSCAGIITGLIFLAVYEMTARIVSFISIARLEKYDPPLWSKANLILGNHVKWKLPHLIHKRVSMFSTFTLAVAVMCCKGLKGFLPMCINRNNLPKMEWRLPIALHTWAKESQSDIRHANSYQGYKRTYKLQQRYVAYPNL